MSLTPEQMAEMFQQLVAMMAAGQAAPRAAPAAAPPVVHLPPPPPKPTLGDKPQPLDIESKRIYLRISDNTDALFRQLSEWLKESGFRIQDRRPKAQVLLHILTHEFAKLSEEERRNIVRKYMD